MGVGIAAREGYINFKEFMETGGNPIGVERSPDGWEIFYDP